MLWLRNMCSSTAGSVLVLFIISQVSSSGVFRLELVQFTNDRGLNSSEGCCQGSLIDSVCSGHCITRIRICLKNYERIVSPDADCTYGEFSSTPLGNNSFKFPARSGNFINPLEFPFTFEWRGDFSLIVEAYHEKVGNSKESDGLIAQFMMSSSVAVADGWRPATYNTSAQSLQFNYSVACDQGYYGTGCLQTCWPRDDELGHYECGPDGKPVCRQGWKGNFCTEAICLPGCDAERGTCSRPNECSCRLGYQGMNCSECVPYPGCMHGYCKQPFQCQCHEGWGGLFCTQDLNYCTNNKPCQNGGTCLNTGEGSFTCSCPVGYTGTACEVKINNCKIAACQNGGTCKDVGNDFVCDCPVGLTGSACEINKTRCDQNPCANGAACQPLGTSSYRCVCTPGWAGVDCLQINNLCNSSPCKNGGRCTSTAGTYRCQCQPGFSGPNCEVNSNDCSRSDMCMNGGTCIDGVAAFECRCVPGFIGALCEHDVDDCSLKPCSNGATCVDKVNDFECLCPPGFTGRFCTEQINECGSSPCMNGATCQDLLNGYFCACPATHEGSECQYEIGKAPSSPTLRTSSPTTPGALPVPVEHVGDPNTAPIISDNSGSVPLTQQQLILIVAFGSGIPMVLLLLLVTILLYRRCKKRQVIHDESEEAQQNQVNSMNNRIHNRVGKELNGDSKDVSTEGKMYEYAPSKVAHDFDGSSHIAATSKNEKAALASKIIHKDLLKDINTAPRDREKHSASVESANVDAADISGDRYLQYYQQRHYSSAVSLDSQSLFNSQLDMQEKHPDSGFEFISEHSNAQSDRPTLYSSHNPSAISDSAALPSDSDHPQHAHSRYRATEV